MIEAEPVVRLEICGLARHNLAGGKLADRRLVPTVIGTLAALAMVLLTMTWALPHKSWMIMFVALLGAAALATVSPLQMWVLQKVDGAGESLASSFNIAAFNLGNALGAWLGGLVVDHGPGLSALPWVAAILPGIAVVLAAASIRADRSSASGRAAKQAEERRSEESLTV